MEQLINILFKNVKLLFRYGLNFYINKSYLFNKNIIILYLIYFLGTIYNHLRYIKYLQTISPNHLKQDYT